jgi:chromosome partitioning protein
MLRRTSIDSERGRPVRTIAFVSQKGGVGKSTLATGLAVAAQQAGEKVLTLDLDPQATVVAWANLRQHSEPAVADLSGKSNVLADVLAQAAQSYSVCILDTAGADSPATHAAMTASDISLIPLRPTRPDGLAVRRTVEALMRTQRRFAFVLSQCPTTRGTRASEMSAGLAAIGYLAEPWIHQRADYQDAFAAGQGPTEFSPDSKASDEMRRLWAWVDKEIRQ